MTDPYDLAVVGGGAAGLMAAIQGARSRPGLRVVVLDRAKTLGAKILIAGGGRCNVTNDVVDASAFAGSSRNAVRRILGRFTVDETLRFFAEEGVELKREETGKLFPVTDQARTILDALLAATRRAHIELAHPWRVAFVRRDGSGDEGFEVGAHDDTRSILARRVILATGGKSLPKSGSDGSGYDLARELGHTVTPEVFPALVPLLLPDGHPLTELSGLSFHARLTVQPSKGKATAAFEDAVLCTHFGLSGPGVLDISRYWRAETIRDSSVRLTLDVVPGRARERLDAALQNLGARTVLSYLGKSLPQRLARTLIQAADISVDRTGSNLSREERKRLVAVLKEQVLPVTGDRGWRYAEVTAGGVPLSELNLGTLESRICPGLYLCGEICDVDGRIGGFNFQWAWSSGAVAGRAAAMQT